MHAARLDGSDPGTTPLSGLLHEALEECRKRILDRIQRVNQETEQETLAAGASLDAAVTEARVSAGESRETLGRLQSSSITRLMEQQTQAVSAYLEQTAQQIQEQTSAADDAIEELDKIVKLVKVIDRVAVEARTLALNATIEAHRMGNQGGAFSVIATEMKRFSESVNQTSQTVQDLAQNLKTTLPRVAQQAKAMKTSSEAFSQDLSSSIETLASSSDEFRNTVTSSMSTTDARLERVLRSAQDALSHLQFQDAVAQHLLVCDADLASTNRWVSEVLTLADGDAVHVKREALPDRNQVVDNQTYSAGRVRKLEAESEPDRGQGASEDIAAGEVLLF